MRFTKGSRIEHVLPVEITPMIDVVFLLMIFFMTTARFAQDTRAELELPRERGEQQEITEEAGLIVNLAADGAIVVGGETLSIEELEALVRGAIGRAPARDAAQLKLLIRADRRGDTARLNDVIERLRRLGVGAARLATEVP